MGWQSKDGSRSGIRASTPHISEAIAQTPGLPPTVAGRSFLCIHNQHAGFIGQGSDHGIGAVNDKPATGSSQPFEKLALGMDIQFFSFQRGNNMLIGLQGKFQLSDRIMENVGKHLRITLVAGISREYFFLPATP